MVRILLYVFLFMTKKAKGLVSRILYRLLDDPGHLSIAINPELSRF